MEKLILDVPAMYGDHHVLEVRRLLSALPGIADIYASSAFQIVEVTYDPQVIDAERIRAPLEQAGYLEPLPVPTETDRPVYQSDDPNVYFRHSAAYAQAGPTVSFAQRVSYAGRPLWPCPGMGPLQRMDEGE
jgi:copper chaperone CopZ